jgi:hypothetical protein
MVVNSGRGVHDALFVIKTLVLSLFILLKGH